MARIIMTLGLLVWFSLPAALAFGLGKDHTKEVIAKRENCVHGYWVNWEDVFFYAGDTAAFNKFIAEYSKMPAVRLRVVIHPGTKKARSPWDKADRNIPVEWSLYVWNTGGLPDPKTPAPTQVDLWLGGRVKLEEVTIPDNIEVVSSGEIEKFVEARQKSQIPQSPRCKIREKALSSSTKSEPSAYPASPYAPFAAKNPDKSYLLNSRRRGSRLRQTVPVGVGQALPLKFALF